LLSGNSFFIIGKNKKGGCVKKLILSIVAAASLLIPVGANAFGIGFYYAPSIPLSDVEPFGVETYDLNPCFSGFGVKFWKNFHSMVAVECYGGYSPSYVSEDGDEGNLSWVRVLSA
jgi:hypothetical protein